MHQHRAAASQQPLLTTLGEGVGRGGQIRELPHSPHTTTQLGRPQGRVYTHSGERKQFCCKNTITQSEEKKTTKIPTKDFRLCNTT